MLSEIVLWNTATSGWINLRIGRAVKSIKHVKRGVDNLPQMFCGIKLGIWWNRERREGVLVVYLISGRHELWVSRGTF